MRAARRATLLLLRSRLTQAVGTGHEVGDLSVTGQRGRLWLARGLTKAAAAGREAGDLPLRVTWPPLVGRWADAGGGRVLRGGGFYPTNDIATWADAGGGCVLRGGRLYYH